MTTEPLILAVDDEAGILRLIKLELTGQGFRVVTASNGREALQLVEERRPDAVLLDVMMPDVTGLEVMRLIRERVDTPILLVTARDRDADKVRGLQLGADDYIVKPFSPEELGARIRAILRRSGAPPREQVVRAGNLEVDLGRRLVKQAGAPLSLTRTEWLLLQHLASNPGKVILTRELLSKVWGPEYLDDLQYLRVWISRLRHKIEPDPANPTIIKTLNGIGYMFQADEADAPTDDPAVAPAAAQG